MPSYQITTDKGVYQVDTEGGQTAPAASTNAVTSTTNTAPATTGISNDLQQASSALDSLGTPDTASPQTSDIPPTPDNTSNLIGQFGKAVYSNPIVHPALKALGDWAGANPDQAYASLGDPSTVAQKVASGLGSAAPLMAIAGPMGMGIEAGAGALAGATRGIPILGKMTAMLGDSQLAKTALTGFSYGAAEGKAMQAQGQNVDIGANASNTAAQFLLWGALAKGGATLGSKFIPKALLKQPELLKNMPLVGPATKNFFTPEGLGSIAGGAVSGALNAPDQQTGIAGAIVGSALSSMNPMEQAQFRKGMGKTLGFGGISAITDHFGKAFAEANDIFEKHGFDDVAKAGTQQIQKPNELGGTDTQSTPQIVNDTYNGAMKEIGKQKSALFDTALMSNENIKPPAMNSFMSLLQQRVNEIKDPTSPVVKQFNKMYEAIQGFQGTTSETEIAGTKDTPNAAPNLRQVTMRELPPAIRMKIQAQQQAQTSSMTLNGLHQIKMVMQEMVSPRSWAGEQAMTSDEKMASGISKQISNFIGKSNSKYSEASKQYAQFKNFQGKVYSLDPLKLSQNILAMDDVHRNIRENELNQISAYLKANGQSKADAKNLLEKYYAYQIYNNPISQGFAKSFAVREVSTAALAGLLHFSGLPGGGLIGGLAGWNMSNPAAWLPVLKGASDAKNLASFRRVAPKLFARKQTP